MPSGPDGAVGRGRHYNLTRAITERLLALLWQEGWAPRLLHRLGGQRQVELLEHRITVADWPTGGAELRIGYASDLHAGPTTHPGLIARAVDRLVEARPDVLLLGGDLVFLRARYIDELAAELTRVPAPLGRFAVLGNHDLWADHRYIEKRLAQAGVRVLVNEAVTLPAPFAHAAVCGLDEPWSGKPDAEATFATAAPHRILLMHAPSGLLLTGKRRFAVAMCGHTHGGHIALPGGIPIVIPGRLSRQYPHGRFDLPEGPLIVSRGVGHVELPLRMFAPSDVLLVQLAGPGSRA